MKKVKKYEQEGAYYVFIDVVGFSKLARTEWQHKTIVKLNSIVTSILNKEEKNEPHISPRLKRKYKNLGLNNVQIDRLPLKNFILLPTGDGVCITLLGVHSDQALKPLDIAKRIIKSISSTNKFRVRIGINECSDYVYLGVNGLPNIVGVGINLCQRVMDSGDENSIMLSQAYHQKISGLNKGIEDFHEFIYKDKHGNTLTVYKYTNRDLNYISNNIPSDVEVEIANSLKDLNKNIKDSFRLSFPLIDMTISYKLKLLNELIAGVNTNNLINNEIYDSPTYTMKVFKNALEILKGNEILNGNYEYMTLTSSSFLTKVEFNTFKNFIEENRNACNKGIKIRRLIFINESEIRDIKKHYDYLNLLKINSNIAYKNNSKLRQTDFLNANKNLNFFILMTEQIKRKLILIENKSDVTFHSNKSKQYLLIRANPDPFKANKNKRKGPNRAIESVAYQFHERSKYLTERISIFKALLNIGMKQNDDLEKRFKHL